MPINAIASVANTQTPKPATDSSPGLGKDDFLKLLVGQLKGQNPMDPMSDQDFMGQMAQFSTLEQVTNTAVTNQAIADQLATAQAVTLIGRTVTYENADEQTVTGKVEKVTFADGKVSLTVGGVEGIEPGVVHEVT